MSVAGENGTKRWMTSGKIDEGIRGEVRKGAQIVCVRKKGCFSS